MTPNYGEIICNAVDEIVTAKLQGLQYDITKLCTIVDDSASYQGKYIISDGTARYEAFTTDVSLKKGNQVQVMIPNGDYNMQKTIIGRIATTDTTPFNYVSPLDTMIKITNNIFDDSHTNYGTNLGLLANDEVYMTEPLYQLEGRENLVGYTRLGVSASFRSWLNGLNIISGSYGIKLLIYTDIVKTTGEQPENAVYELTFSSADMIGNPYQFDDYFSQEKVFDISSINNITKIDVYFYQDGNFLDGDNELISCFDPLGNKKPNNLFVKDVKIFLGYETEAFTEETLMLYSPDPMSYRYDKKDRKRIYLRWVHKIDEKTYEIINENNFDDNLYEIRWFKYNPGVSKIDQYAGKDWELIQTNNFLYQLFPEVKNQQEQIKVIGLIKNNQIVEGIPTATPYFSNLLVFENEELVPDQTTLQASTALSIYCEDNSEGNYFLYNQNGKIINEGNGKGHIRYLKVMYMGAELTKEVGTVNWIKWFFPKAANESLVNKAPTTMLNITKDMYTDSEINKNYYSYRGTEYIEIQREGQEGTLPELRQKYQIENYWSNQKSNNTVICRISINGVEYQAIKELHFGKAGSNGTNITFMLEFENTNALVVPKKDDEESQSKGSAVVRARLYSEDSAAAGNVPNPENIKWDWYRATHIDENGDMNNAKQYMYFEPVENDNSAVIVSLTNEVVDVPPIDNYYILKASYTIGNNTLEAYLPIPIKIEECQYIEGAREVIYDHQGNPSYYNDAYIAYKLDGDEYKEYDSKNWRLICDETFYINNDDEEEEEPVVPGPSPSPSPEPTPEPEPGDKEAFILGEALLGVGYLGEIKAQRNSKVRTYSRAKQKDSSSPEIVKTISNSYIPRLKEPPNRKGYKALSAAPFYMSGYADKVCVYLKNIWSQPLLIMQSKYDFSMLNEWDGTLNIDEDNGTILSTMLGAGRKENDNSYSGVLIGDVRQGTNLESFENITGIYGLHHGQISYALKEDGTATFGKKGKGQIQIDGNTGVIKSSNYASQYDEDGNLIKTGAVGLEMNLTDGTFIARDENGRDKIILSSLNNSAAYLQVYGKDTLNDYGDIERHKLIHIDDIEYYLHSANYQINKNEITKGMAIDLANGYINIVADSSSLHKTFLIKNELSNPLISIGGDEKSCFLQSGEFLGQRQQFEEYNGLKYYKYKNPRDFPIDSNTSILADSICYHCNNEFYDENLSLIKFNTYWQIYDEKNNIKEEQSGEYRKMLFASSLVPVVEDIEPTGMKLDLNAGSIEGYNLYLAGKNGDNILLIDTSADVTPFRISNNFSVNWDGTVTCSKVNSLNNDGRGQYAISFGNNFYVTSGGTAGGGTWQGSSLGVAGYSQKPITSGGTTYYVLGK